MKLVQIRMDLERIFTDTSSYRIETPPKSLCRLHTKIQGFFYFLYKKAERNQPQWNSSKRNLRLKAHKKAIKKASFHKEAFLSFQ
jgi:hypothetical protein